MRSALVLAVRAALLAIVLPSVGCFRPNIRSGGFRCGEGGACPDNLVCDHRHDTCVSSITDGGAGTTGTGGAAGKGGQGGSGGVAGMDGGMRDAPPDRACLDKVTCTPSDAAAGLCDPVCNTGCGACYEKCSVNTNSDLTCNGINPPNQPPVGLLQNCSPYRPVGVPTEQTDNCGPGQVCLNASACGVPRCYEFCRSNSDCPQGASCSRDGGAYQFCDVPPVSCNPLPGATNPACVGATACFLSNSGVGTLCDCQFSRAAWPNTSGSRGDLCNESRDCLTGNVCLLEVPAIGKQCFPICPLPVDGGPMDQCIGGCQPIAPGSPYGWCNN